jgi:hypothetical protein
LERGFRASIIGIQLVLHTCFSFCLSLTVFGWPLRFSASRIGTLGMFVWTESFAFIGTFVAKNGFLKKLWKIFRLAKTS